MLGGGRVLCIHPAKPGHSYRSRPGALLRRGARLVVPGRHATRRSLRCRVFAASSVEDWPPLAVERQSGPRRSSPGREHVLGAATDRNKPAHDRQKLCRDNGLLAGGRARSCRNPQPATRNPQPATRNPQPATRNPQPATRNHKRVAEAHIAAAAPPTKRTSHHQPATTSLPMVLPLSRRRCASRRVCAQIGESVSVWVVRSSPASIRLAARLRMRCCSTMSSVA